MDLKALMQKLEIIDKKEILTEAEKKETTWTDKSGKSHPATKVKGKSYGGQAVADDEEDKPKAKKKVKEDFNFKSSIAQELLREFNLDEADPATQVSTPPGAPAFAKDISIDGKTGQTPDQIKAGLSPEQLKWLGGADPTDPIIMARLKKAVPDKPKAAAPTGMTATRSDDGSTLVTDPAGGTTAIDSSGQVYKPGSNPNLPQNKAAAPGGAVSAAGKADPAKLKRFQELLAKAAASGEQRSASQLAATADIAQSGGPM